MKDKSHNQVLSDPDKIGTKENFTIKKTTDYLNKSISTTFQSGQLTPQMGRSAAELPVHYPGLKLFCFDLGGNY